MMLLWNFGVGLCENNMDMISLDMKKNGLSKILKSQRNIYTNWKTAHHTFIPFISLPCESKDKTSVYAAIQYWKTIDTQHKRGSGCQSKLSKMSNQCSIEVDSVEFRYSWVHRVLPYTVFYFFIMFVYYIQIRQYCGFSQEIGPSVIYMRQG